MQNAEHNENNKYLIVKCSRSGIGDRIHTALTGIAYAKITNRILHVDWTDGSLIPDKANLFDYLFELKNIEYTRDRPYSTDVNPVYWKNRLDVTVRELYEAEKGGEWDRRYALKKYSVDLKKLDHPAQIVMIWRFDNFPDVVKHYGADNHIEFKRCLYKEHLEINRHFRSKADEFAEKYFDSTCHIVGLHIRATEEFSKNKNGLVGIKQYIHTVNKVVKKVKGNVKIFLATDNSAVVDSIRQAFPGRVITRDKWFPAPGMKMHLNQDCNDQYQVLEDAMTEMILLSRADSLICQNNSFFALSARVMSDISDSNFYPMMVRHSFLTRLKNKVFNR